MNVLRNRLPYKVEAEEDRYKSYQQMVLLSSPGLAVDAAVGKKCLLGLIDHPILHFVNKENLDGSALTFYFDPLWSTMLAGPLRVVRLK